MEEGTGRDCSRSSHPGGKEHSEKDYRGILGQSLIRALHL